MAKAKPVGQSSYISPPLKGLIQIIAKAVVEDYRQELERNRQIAEAKS